MEETGRRRKERVREEEKKEKGKLNATEEWRL